MSTATAPTATSTWNIDPVHSVAEFKVKHMMIANVKGQFTGATGRLILNEADPTKSQVEATIDASTINTHESDRDSHLKNADFLDVEKFPTITFKSTRVSQTKDGELTVDGELTIHGTTRKVVFAVEGPSVPVKDPWGNTRLGVSGTTKISRKDFGLVWNATLETGGYLIGDEVTITIEAEFVKAA